MRKGFGHSKIYGRAAGLWALAVLAACGSATPEEKVGPADTAEIAQQDVATTDSFLGSDVPVGVDAGDGFHANFDVSEVGQIPDVPPDVFAFDVNTSSCNFANPQPGECGFSCVDDKKCLSGFCVPTRTDKVCTTTCGSVECPGGWTCRQLATAPDAIFGCVPESLNLGRPCGSDLDCIAAIGQTIAGVGDVCIPAGSDGNFCGSDCSSGQKCVAGFSCKSVQSISGKLAKQCVADKIDDNCTERYEFEKAETACTVQNADGTCKGKRHCEGGKSSHLSACDAAQPAPELCNQKDDNCNGVVDEPVANAKCQVTVGKFSCPGTPLCSNGVETCIGQKPSAEACNGLDDNCNGATDEGCDDDQDGYCDTAMLFDPSTKPCLKGGGDCDDKDAGVFPKAKEVCDGADNDCNGQVDALDPGLTLSDPQQCENQKGVCGGATKAAQLCVNGKWLACGQTEYTGHNPSYGKTEVCDDKDNDCSGSADDGCDDDLDGYCDAALATIGFPLVCTKGGGDCQDDNAKALPGGLEVCNDLDDNCNGATDELCDKDKDGYCDAIVATTGKPKACASGGGDCDDLNKNRHPGASELCNGQDDDCSGSTDEAFPTLGKACADGQGVCNIAGKFVCAPDGSVATCSVLAQKGGDEICDGLDNDCDGQIDEGCDDDQDGYCDVAMATAGKPAVCKNGGGDCNDLQPTVKPGVAELCNGKDDDCDGKTDAKDGDLGLDDPQECEKQAGVCKGAKKSVDLCVGGKWLTCGDEVYAGWNGNFSTEVCDNADNDCDGSVDQGCDDDTDGYCDVKMTVLGKPTVCKFSALDCNDNLASVNPGSSENCDNLDNDCNNTVDDKCDKDGDGYCDTAKNYAPPAGGKVSVCGNGPGDCDDGDAKIHPGGADLCADFVDDNCSGVTDEGCAPTVLGYKGELGPNYAKEGFLLCGGWLDQPATDDIPPAWGSQCVASQWNRLRVACGPFQDKVRYIDVKKNVFKDGLANLQEVGLIYNSNFDLGGNNLIKADSSDLSSGRSWWGAQFGCSETLSTLNVNNGSCGWEAANCFGQNVGGSRYLFVYVGK